MRLLFAITAISFIGGICHLHAQTGISLTSDYLKMRMPTGSVRSTNLDSIRSTTALLDSFIIRNNYRLIEKSAESFYIRGYDSLKMQLDRNRWTISKLSEPNLYMLKKDSLTYIAMLNTQSAQTTFAMKPFSLPVLPQNASMLKPFVEVNKIVAKDRSDNDQFGQSVAISGNYAVVGVPLDDEDVNGENPIADAGSAYIFHLDDSGKWKQLQKIVASERGDGDNFGWSVGISGNYIVVGAIYEDQDANEMNTMLDAGSAYVFKRDSTGTWYQLQKIVAAPASRDGQNLFGYAVAIEGNVIVVGSPSHSRDLTDDAASNVTDAGALFVFEQYAGKWTQVAKLIAPDRHLGSGLGNSVSICGSNIIAGALGEDHDAQGTNRLEAAGGAYIFERSGGTWAAQKVVARDRSPHDEFGFSVGISGTYAIVGARSTTETADEDSEPYTGNAYVFYKDSDGGWKQMSKINPPDRKGRDQLGTSVGISGDYLIVTARGQDTDSAGNLTTDIGAVYVYYLDKSGAWIQTGKLSSSDKVELDGLGYAAAISNCTIIATTIVDAEDANNSNPITNAGSAYIFTAKECRNDGRCSGRLWPGAKTPRVKN
ncbi:MAG TPA: hypothetical protein VGD17_07525 [Chitinophagaceae bacterium]